MTAVGPHRAWRFSIEDRWGVSVERAHEELTPASGGPEEWSAGLGVGAPPAGEDAAGLVALAVSFETRALMGLDGELLMVVAGPAGNAFAIRGPEIRTEPGDAMITFDYTTAAPLTLRWAYARRPAVAATVLAPPDEPDAVVEADWLERSDVPEWLVAIEHLAAVADWHEVEIGLPPSLSDVGVKLDRAEQLLGDLDRELGIGARWRWSTQATKLEQLDPLIAAFELRRGDGHDFSLTVESSGTELVRGRRIEALVRRNIEVVDETGRRSVSVVGVT